MARCAEENVLRIGEILQTLVAVARPRSRRARSASPVVPPIGEKSLLSLHQAAAAKDLDVETRIALLHRHAAHHRQRGALRTAKRYLRSALDLLPELQAVSPMLAGSSPVWKGVAGQAVLHALTLSNLAEVEFALGNAEEATARAVAALQTLSDALEPVLQSGGCAADLRASASPSFRRELAEVTAAAAVIVSRSSAGLDHLRERLQSFAAQWLSDDHPLSTVASVERSSQQPAVPGLGFPSPRVSGAACLTDRSSLPDAARAVIHLDAPDPFSPPPKGGAQFGSLASESTRIPSDSESPEPASLNAASPSAPFAPTSRPATPYAASTAPRRVRSVQERPPRPSRLPSNYSVSVEVQRLRYRSKVVDAAGAALGLVSRDPSASVTQRRAEQVVALARAGLVHDSGDPPRPMSPGLCAVKDDLSGIFRASREKWRPEIEHVQSVLAQIPAAELGQEARIPSRDACGFVSVI